LLGAGEDKATITATVSIDPHLDVGKDSGGQLDFIDNAALTQ